MKYHYIGYSGENTLVRGVLNANTEKAAAELLSGQGYKVLTLKPALGISPGLRAFLFSSQKVDTDTIAMFTRQMATLLEAGLNVITAIEMLQVQATNRTFKDVLGKIIADIRGGTRLSVAMGKHSRVFPTIYWRTIAVGEQTGELGSSLNQVAEYLEKSSKTRKGIKSALTYPIILCVLAIGVVILLANFVLPTFIGLYNTLGAKLPTISRVFISLTDALRHYGLYGLAVLLIGGLLFMVYIRRPAGQKWWDGAKLKFPALGKIIHMRELANCSRTISVLFRCGLPLPDIIDIVSDNSGNLVFKDSLANIKKSMLKGEGLSKPMSRDPMFLPLMVQMTKVGEESGGLDSSLLTVSQTYDVEADNRTKQFVSVIQPAITIAIGVVIAFVVVSMVSVMYSIYGQM